MAVFGLLFLVISMMVNVTNLPLVIPAVYHALSHVNTALCGPQATALSPYLQFVCGALNIMHTSAVPSVLLSGSDVYNLFLSNSSVYDPFLSGYPVNGTLLDEPVLVYFGPIYSPFSDLIVAPKFELSISIPSATRSQESPPVRRSSEPSSQILNLNQVALSPGQVIVEWILYLFILAGYVYIFGRIVAGWLALRRSLLDLFPPAVQGKQPEAEAQPEVPRSRRRHRRRRQPIAFSQHV
ncbi:hypothetical protein BDY19DRAFT_473924 [Irpex rosettiformis]|uniref:Uncharacterized protein n=1 Tax=Irpex rosettiformis TaxID=378272 RepID=A0ACB8TSL8_9APHY|nr:hypothetical protein BDY19DRAFT_473924 [Irpex rosettiformis]